MRLDHFRPKIGVDEFAALRAGVIRRDTPGETDVADRLVELLQAF